jgi:cbb3-type cytochrome oxidase maturation protein
MIESLIWLVPIALLMGIAALIAFLWSARNGQYDDLDGAAYRILMNLDADRPAEDPAPATEPKGEATNISDGRSTV